MKQAFLFLFFLTLCLNTQGFSFSGLAHADEDSAEPVNKSESRKTRATHLMNITGDAEFADDRLAWDKTYNRKDYVYGKNPAAFLAAHIDKLPKGRVLDIAMGEGRNAVFLAKKGFLVEGVDISSVGIKKAQKLAAENGVKIQAVNADLNKYRIRPGSYSVILNFYYLQRSLFPEIIAGLKKGGVVVFESNTTEQLKNPGAGDFGRDMLLEPGELRRAFSDLEIVYYAETNDGRNAVASLIARKK
jgi:tellurite methyltransferase